MKKCIFTLLCCIMLFGMNAYAKSYEAIFETVPDYAVTVGYADGIIESVDIIKPENSKICFETVYEEFLTYLMYDGKIQKAEVKEKLPDTEEDEVVKEEANKKEFPDVYKKEKHAIRAMMVVDNVIHASDSKGTYYDIEFYYHGELKRINIPDDIEITVAPVMYSEFVGENAGTLKKGDVIAFSASFSGVVDGISLLFRPVRENPLTYEEDLGTAFSFMYAAENGTVAGVADYSIMTPQTGIKNNGYGYTFGAVVEKKDRYMVICDKDMNTLEIDIADGAIVYKCDAADKFKLETAKASSIKKTYLPKSSFDEDENLIELPGDADYKYVFVRTVDGEATEIVFFTNYNE